MDPFVERTLTHRSWIRELVIGLAVQTGTALLLDVTHVVARLLSFG